MDLRNSPSSIVGNSYHWHSVQAVNLSSKPQSSEFCNSWLLAPDLNFPPPHNRAIGLLAREIERPSSPLD
jgi:hypothetical protein